MLGRRRPSPLTIERTVIHLNTATAPHRCDHGDVIIHKDGHATVKAGLRREERLDQRRMARREMKPGAQRQGIGHGSVLHMEFKDRCEVSY